MQRELFEQRLNELLDLRASPEDDAQLGDDTLLDDEQREVMRAQRLMVDGLVAGEIPSLSDDFAERVVAQVRSERAVETKRSAGSLRISLVVLTAACAALLLVAAIPLWSWLSSPSDVIDVAGPNPPTASPDVNVPSDAAQRPDSNIADNSNDNVTPPDNEDSPILVVPYRPATDEQIARRYREMYRIISELSGQPEGAAEPDLLAMRPQWVDEMASGLKPVATSVGGAINVLRRNLPPSEKSDPAEKPQAHNYADADSQLA